MLHIYYKWIWINEFENIKSAQGKASRLSLMDSGLLLWTVDWLTMINWLTDFDWFILIDSEWLIYRLNECSNLSECIRLIDSSWLFIWLVHWLTLFGWFWLIDLALLFLTGSYRLIAWLIDWSIDWLLILTDWYWFIDTDSLMLMHWYWCWLDDSDWV